MCVPSPSLPIFFVNLFKVEISLVPMDFLPVVEHNKWYTVSICIHAKALPRFSFSYLVFLYAGIYAKENRNPIIKGIINVLAYLHVHSLLSQGICKHGSGYV